MVNIERLYLRFGSLEMDAKVSVINIVNIVELSWSLWHLAWLTHVGAIHSLQCWTPADYAWLLVHISVHLFVSNRTAVQQVIVGVWVIDHVSWFDLHTLSNSSGIPPARSTSHWCHLTSSCILSGRRLIDIVDLVLPVARHGHVKLIPSILRHLLILEDIASYILIDANLTHADLFIFFFCLRFIDLICQHEVRKFLQRKVRLALEVDIEYVFENHWVWVELTEEQVLVLSAFSHKFLLNINVEVSLDRVHVESRIGWRCSDYVIKDVFAFNIADVWFFDELHVQALSQIKNRIHDWKYFEPVEKQSNQSFIEHMLLFRKLSAQQCICEENQIIFEVFIMVSNEMIALFVRSIIVWALHRLFLVINEWFWRWGQNGSGLVRSEYLRLQLDLFIDYFLHRPQQDVNHNQLPVEITLQFGKEYPFKSEVEAFTVKKVFERLNVCYCICIFDDFGDLIYCLGKQLFDWILVCVVYHRVFQFELGRTIMSHNESISLNDEIVAWVQTTLALVICVTKDAGHTRNIISSAIALNAATVVTAVAPSIIIFP